MQSIFLAAIRGRSSVGTICSFVAFLAFATANKPATCDALDGSKGEAERLISAAVSAEVSGDHPRAQSLLQDAVKADPDSQLAHWQLGQMQVDGKWVAADEAQRQAAADPLQVEYRQRRAATGASLQQQLTLARWCRDNKLNDESQLHWAVVLSLDPTNKESLKAVDMMWKNGRLVSRTAKPEEKQHAEEAKSAAKHWEPIIAKWRRAVSGRDVEAHDAALAEIRGIKELDAIPSMESVTLGKDANDLKHAEECLQVALAFIDALSKLQSQPATDSLVRHAVLQPGNKARALAAEKLKARDQHDYIPLLLSGLAMPIESSYNVTTDASGNVHYSHALYREGAESDWSYNLNKTTSQQDLGGRVSLFDTYTGNATVGPPAESPLVTTAKISYVASKAENRYGQNVSATETNVARVNAAAEELNSRIVPVLTTTSGKDYGDNPKAWWDWWRSANEYYLSEHPVDQHYGSERNNYYYNYPESLSYSSAPRPRSHSCFAKGTLVWTKTGKKPIESVELGELVLSQEVDSGELKYQPVLGTTVRPPSPMLKLTLNKEQLITTLGHPFWVSGVGWRMSKELGEDAMLHTINGSSRVRSVESEADATAYNLIVANFNTYFVGDSGLLVHDNTQHRSAQVVIPGVPLK